MPVSLTETFYGTVKTRLETILTDATYSLFGTLQSVQFSAYRFDGGERALVNSMNAETIIISDVDSVDSSEEEVDTWHNRLTVQCLFVTKDGDLLSLIRAYEDMKRALNPATLPKFTLMSCFRRYTDPTTDSFFPGVVLEFSGVYRASMSDPSQE